MPVSGITPPYRGVFYPEPNYAVPGAGGPTRAQAAAAVAMSQPGGPGGLPTQLAAVPGVDLSPGLDGSVMGFVVEAMAAGQLEDSAKEVDSVTWSGNFDVATACGQFSILVTSLPLGVTIGSALAQGLAYIYDGGSNPGPLPVIRGDWSPGLYVPPKRSFVVFISNDDPTVDPDEGAAQRVYVQWRIAER